jgi:hypothetical protein
METVYIVLRHERDGHESFMEVCYAADTKPQATLFVKEACEDDPNVWWEIVTMSLNSTEIAPHMVAMYSDDGSEMSLS